MSKFKNIINGWKQLVYFSRRQIKEIRQGGLSVLSRKVVFLFRKLCGIPLILLAVPVVFLIRIVRPWIIIRFGLLYSDRLGHFAGNTEVYLCERDTGIYNSRNFDIFYYKAQICNYQLKKMWDRTLRISSLVKWADKANRILPGGKSHIISFPSNDRDIYNSIESIPVHLSFTVEEELLGKENLKKMGILDDNLFVCFQARDSLYLKTVFKDGCWDYHNYRDSDIHNYIFVAEELVRKGYFAVRMGAAVKEKLNIANSKIIDYATKGRTDFLDIFLGAKCHFYLGDSCGICAVPMIFRRPLAIVNMIPLEYALTWGSKNLFIPKKLWLKSERRFLRFKEILNSGIGRFVNTKQYTNLGIEVIENTPEEIAALAIEMDERLKDKWQAAEEDEELQRRFWLFFKPSELNQVFASHIGAEFLRQNKELLD